ncbi:MAG: hypothetical protein PHQ23_17100 [Candidatus Wallbacteria bacterium]|nr:hypothetical protein [Candidatus Wallbacteria bacterium]
MNLKRAVPFLFDAFIIRKPVPLVAEIDLNQSVRDSKQSDRHSRCIPDFLKSIGVRRITVNCRSIEHAQAAAAVLAGAFKHGIFTSLIATPESYLELGKMAETAGSLQFRIDSIRPGSRDAKAERHFQFLVRGLEAAAGNGRPLCLLTSMNRYNCSHVEDLVHLAGMYRTIIGFEPMGMPSGQMSSPWEEAPDKESYQSAVATLMALKRTWQSRFIRNSLSGLLHIYGHPDYNGLACSAGRLFFTIIGSGEIIPCPFSEAITPGFPISLENEPSACAQLLNKSLVSCRGCGFIGRTELNFFGSGRLLPLIHLSRLL